MAFLYYLIKGNTLKRVIIPSFRGLCGTAVVTVMTVDPNARYVPLEGLSMAIVVISTICVVFSILAVGLRTYARLADGLFGTDDGLVLFGTVRWL